jgi:hypothetical protein
MNGKKYHVRLTEAEKKRLLEITKKGKHPARRIIRANILLHLDEDGASRTIAEQKEREINHKGAEGARKRLKTKKSSTLCALVVHILLLLSGHLV